MAALGKLVVNLSANIAEFQSAMDKAAYTATNRMDKIAKVSAVAGAAIGGALVAGAGALANELMKFATAADEAVKSAQRIGVSVESLTRLQYAAEMSGVAAEDLQGAMGKLSKAAAEGSDAFAAMGVNVKAADGSLKSTDQLLAEVADKFASYKDGAEKSALAQELFGKSGAQLIPLLNGGSAGLAEMAAEADALGIVFGEKAAKSAEAFNDNLTRLAKVKDGIIAKVAAGLLPAMENLSSMMVNAARNTKFFDGVAQVLSATLKGLAVVGAGIWGVFDALGTAIASVAVALVQVAKGNFSVAQQVLENGGRQMVDTVKNTVETVEAIFSKYEQKNPQDSGGGIAAPLVSAVGAARKAREQLEREADAARKAQERAAAAARKALESEGDGVRKANRSPSEILGEDISRLNVLLQEGVITWDTYSRAVFAAQDAFDETVEAARKQEQQLAEQRQRTRDGLYSGLMSEEEEIKQSYERRRAAILTATEISENERADLLKRLQEKTDKELLAASDDYWTRWLVSAEKSLTSFDELAGNIVKSASERFGAMFEKMIFDSQTVGEALHTFAEGMLRSIVNALGQMAAQWVAYQLVQKAMGANAAAGAMASKTAEAQAASVMAGLNAFASTAAIPVTGPALAPAAAAAAVAATQPMAATVSALMASAFAGAYDKGGMIPSGQWGIVGEYGPEIVQGPASVTSRADTAAMLNRGTNIRIVNAFDTAVIGDYMGSDAGEQLVMNAVRRNQSALRALVAA